MTVLNHMTPREYANEQIRKTGVCQVTWDYTDLNGKPAKNKGVLIGHPDRLRTDSPFYDSNRNTFLFVGFDLEIRICCGFDEKLHPKVKFRNVPEYV